jgi:asparagine synthase (glutamine-hydrolysing)
LKTCCEKVTASTTTDTEVLLHLYEEHGRIVARMNGQFALAIWDARKKSCSGGTGSAFGLCITILDNTLIFASEIKSILRIKIPSPD